MKALTSLRSSRGSQVMYPALVCLSWLCSVQNQGAGSCVQSFLTCFGSQKEEEGSGADGSRPWLPSVMLRTATSNASSMLPQADPFNHV